MFGLFVLAWLIFIPIEIVYFILVTTRLFKEDVELKIFAVVCFLSLIPVVNWFLFVITSFVFISEMYGRIENKVIFKAKQ